ncbi:hypothetical protein PHYSODRAFT_262290 [Phytophthora sojae]|uniref:Uncharacterized protein n=1 Tax=Phytophthora sojae (strain P6497) TaxID=1094619 RepID=G4ZS55_PHYSP|nr:hypothetical protein PHYSODRAFT_262290 [Phytophthora sojae]EGZ14351.1 hypothetical protein PHYSODRAFT_262290 [Phytophthora sojae]|eukprot:XP_009531780.1 hypothetical protein PHYSODRAFT_262290 [Phytophthora sojae]
MASFRTGGAIPHAHEGVFRQPALLRVLLGLVRDVRAAANVHVTKCDPSLVPVEGMSAAASTSVSVQQHQPLQDCLLAHGILKRLQPLSSESSDNEVAEESRALLCTIVNELLTADAEVSSPSPPRLLLAMHTQGYDVTLVPTLVAHMPAMKLMWDHWMVPTSSNSSGSSSSRSATPGTKPLMGFVAEGAEKDLPKWRFRLRVNADPSAELVCIEERGRGMNGSTGLSRSDKVSAISAASPTASSSSPRVYIPVSPNTLSPRSAEAVGDSSTLGSGSGLVSSIKNFKRKKNARERLHPLESESPRYPRHYQQQRHLPVVPSSPSRYPDSPRAPKGALEDSDDEVIQLKRLNAHLASGETVEEWIRSYEVERGNFASFAMFTEVKLDEVQEGYVEQVGRPNAVEAAACCATLLKMLGIVGCYRTLLEKMSAGIQGAIYLPDASLSSIVTDATSPDAMFALVQSFYSRTPYFERVRELKKTLLASRSITDPTVLRAVSVDDVARIFQYVPFAHVQAGIAKVYATNSAKLDQLVNALQEQQGLLLLRRKEMGINDPDYPVHVPLATSAQICRAITHNAASFSSSGRDMILCAIVGLVDADSFRALRSSREDVLFAYLTYTEGMDQLELVVDALPNAGESLFRLYLATCSGRVGDLPDESPKDVFFLKLLSPDMGRPGREEQWLLLSKEYEKNDNERKARKLRRASVNASDFDIEIEEDTTDGRSMSQSSTAASIERFQIIMLNYLRHHSLSSAQLLQLMLKTLFKMLSREERAAWIDRINFKHPTDSYKKRIQDLKDAVAAAKSAPPDLSDPGAHISRMKADLKVRWLEAIMEYALNETESSARLAALNQAHQPFANVMNSPSCVSAVESTELPLALSFFTGSTSVFIILALGTSCSSTSES